MKMYITVEPLYNEVIGITNIFLTPVTENRKIFNNYSPKAQLILLNNTRDEVEGVIQQY